MENKNKERLTEKGLIVYTERLKTLIKFFNACEFPKSVRVLGFPNLNIKSKYECLIRIQELSEIIGIQWNLKTEILKQGKIEIKKETIIWPIQ